MKYLLTFFLLVLIPLVAAYDYLKFVEMWHPTVCRLSRCFVYPAQPIFTIHGLWPSNYNGIEPMQCTGQQTLNTTQLKDHCGADLLNKWPSIYGYSNESFWIHEWNEHGTCFIQFVNTGGTPMRYFDDALACKNTLDVKATLAAAGINPANARRHSTAHILSILRVANRGFNVELYCDRSGDIQEVRRCLTPDANRIRHCPKTRNTWCGSTVRFPLT